MLRPPPRSTPFPYPTLFRSGASRQPRAGPGPSHAHPTQHPPPRPLARHPLPAPPPPPPHRESTPLHPSHKSHSYAPLRLEKKKKNPTVSHHDNSPHPSHFFH